MKKIITLGISMLFILTAMISVEAAEIKNDSNEETASDIVTVKIYAFYDYNENGVQDEDTEKGDHAIDFFVFSSAKRFFTPEIAYKGKTNNEGKISFETEKSHNFRVWVRQKQDTKPSQYKGYVGGPWDPITDYEGVIKIPVTYHKRVSIETHTNPILINILARFINQFPLFQQLLNL